MSTDGGAHGSTESSNSNSNESANDINVNNKTNTDTSPGNSLDEVPPGGAPKTAIEASPPPKSPGRRRLVQATELRFQCIEGRSSVSRVAVLLCNISDRPLYYKFKTDTMDLLSALPSATGHIAARGSSRVVLTWQRPKANKTWHSVSSPKLLLVTHFLDSGGMKKETTSTRLIACLDASTTCPSDNPPIEQLMLDALSKSAAGKDEMTVTKSDNDSSTHPLEAPPVNTEGVNPNITLLLALVGLFIAVCLYRALFPVAVVVR